jgi:hypothetical protein
MRGSAARPHPADLPAAPSVRAISATFGNTLQVGVPMTAALFGEVGLGIHITIVSLHALTLLTVITTLVELDLARAKARHEPTASLAATMGTTLRNTIVHPVVLPVLAGMAFNATGLPLPPVVDEVLETARQRRPVPLCLELDRHVARVLRPARAARGAIGLGRCVKLPGLPALGAAHRPLGLRASAGWQLGGGGDRWRAACRQQRADVLPAATRPWRPEATATVVL